jgi:hypothetical protein
MLHCLLLWLAGATYSAASDRNLQVLPYALTPPVCAYVPMPDSERPWAGAAKNKGWSVSPRPELFLCRRISLRTMLQP